MKSRGFLALLAGAISISVLTAGEQPPRSRSNDPNPVHPLRGEVLERPLDSLMDRCQRMLDMQLAVYDGTRGLCKVIAGRKPSPRDRQAALKLSESVRAIVLEATKAIDMLEAEGAAAAFAEVFREVREDLKRVQRRLASSDVGSDTQALQRDIIDTLQEMIKSYMKR